MGIDLQDGVILMVISGKKHKILIRIPWIKSYDLGPGLYWSSFICKELIKIVTCRSWYLRVSTEL
jgi:hypothetical protein